MTISLIVGIVLAAAALAYVMLPLLVGSADGAASGRNDRVDPGSQSGSVTPKGAGAIEVLREIEFDRATGKLSDADYGELKTTYTARALAEMRDVSTPHFAGAVTSPASPMEVSPLLRGRDATSPPASSPSVCPVCGPRPEPDARYCSNCARFLAGACVVCGTSVTQPAARHCTDCGHRLAA